MHQKSIVPTEFLYNINAVDIDDSGNEVFMILNIFIVSCEHCMYSKSLEKHEKTGGMNVRSICIHFCTESKLYLICNKIVESIVHSISALLIQKEPWWWYLCAWMLKITTIYIRTVYSLRSKWLFIRKYGQCVLELYTRSNPILMRIFCLHSHPINKSSNSNKNFVCISDISLTINFVANKKNTKKYYQTRTCPI